MGKKKLVIEQVDNGFIVKVLKTGLSPLKDPYSKPVYVFGCWDDLETYLVDELYISSPSGQERKS